jgi:hypothetical protein
MRSRQLQIVRGLLLREPTSLPSESVMRNVARSHLVAAVTSRPIEKARQPLQRFRRDRCRNQVPRRRTVSSFDTASAPGMVVCRQTLYPEHGGDSRVSFDRELEILLQTSSW